MMRKILLLLCFFCALNTKSLEEVYLQGGLAAVKNAIEANLQDKNYWRIILKDKDVRYGYYDTNTLITIVDKSSKTLELFYYNNGKLDEKFSVNRNVITGLMGDKLREGDLKTPVGVYDITKHFTPKDNYYGPTAFALSYPNLYDTLRKRNGSGIWIHGFPMDGKRIDSLKTLGCVAIDNNSLLKYENIVGDRGGIVIINESGKVRATKDQIASILAQLFVWRQAWSDNDIKTYLDFYDKSFIRFDGQKYDTFSKMKKGIFAKKENKQIYFSNFTITPYPSTSNGKFFRINFNEKYIAPNYKFEGRKTIYARLDGDKMKILIEK